MLFKREYAATARSIIASALCACERAGYAAMAIAAA
jgi:hypothetical protein